MTTAMTTMKKWQDEYLATMIRVEEPVLKVTGKAVEAVGQYVPAMPHWAFLDQVPTMTEIVDSQLKFNQRVVAEQTAFVRKLMKTMTPAKASPAPRAKAAPVRRVRAAAA
ncbi:MAG: hypothetical protein ABI862_09190 [Ilumatobacteraceae bacterium]